MASNVYYPLVSSDDGYVVTDNTFINNTTDMYVEYGDTYDKHLFVRFPDIDIPRYATITNAYLILTLFLYGSGTVVTTRIKFEKVSDAIAVTSYSDYVAKDRTTAYVDWEFDRAVTGDWSTNGGNMVPVQSADISTVVQELVNQSGWRSGNAVQLLLEAIGDDANVNFNPVDYAYDAELHVEWTYEGVVDLESEDVILEAIASIPDVSFVAQDYTPITIQDVFLNSRQEYFEYELLTLQDGVYKHSKFLDIVDRASISLDFNRDVIGAATFKIKNDESINYISNVIKPWICKVYQGETYKYPLGMYLLTYPDMYSDSILVTRNIYAYDLTLVLSQDKFDYPPSFAKGTNVVSAVESILDGIGAWVQYYIQPSEEVLSEDMSYEMSKSKLFVINSLLNTINYVPIFCTGNGAYRSMAWSESNNIIWDFEDNENSLYASGIRVSNNYTEIFNKVIIITNQLEEDTEPFKSVLTFEDIGLADHPLSITSLDRTIVKIFNSEAVSQDYVDLRAKRELLKMLEISQTIAKKHLFVTSRNDGLPYYGDCFRFKNSLLNIDSVFKIESMRLDLQVGSLAISEISKVVSTNV